MTGPQDPVTALAQAAAVIHEMYRSFVASGFTEPQALYLTGKFVEAQARPHG